MDKKAIIQELRDWNNAVLFAQARSFLEPFGLTIRFDADVFDENERIIRIGGGESTWDVPADYLTIVCPISDEDRQQLKQQEYRNRLRDKELTEHIRKLVVQFEDQNFETEGHSVLISDEYHDACYVYGFRVNEDVLYALLDYDDGRLRTVPVSDLCVVELFDAFWLLVQNA